MNAQQKQAAALEAHFAFQHANPPAPFNPHYDPQAGARSSAVVASMEADGLYQSMPIEARRLEYARRYDALKAAGK